MILLIIVDYLDGIKLTNLNKVRLLELPSIILKNNFIYSYSLHNKKDKEEKKIKTLKSVHFRQSKCLIYYEKRRRRLFAKITFHLLVKA